MWDDGAIWRGAREGRLVLRACRQCSAICHPPLPMCPGCQAADWEERAAAGQATLHAWFREAADAGGDEPRTIIVAQLAEGVRFVSNLIDAPAPGLLAQGMALDLCFVARDGVALPVFRLADDAR